MIITDLEIINKLSNKVRPLRSESPEISYIKAIAKRFDDKYQLNLFDHIKTITKVGYVIAQGFYFTPISLFYKRRFLEAGKNHWPSARAQY